MVILWSCFGKTTTSLLVVAVVCSRMLARARTCCRASTDVCALKSQAFVYCLAESLRYVVCCAAQSEARTYQDLLQDPHDETVFEHFTTVSIVSIKVTRSCRNPNPARIA